MLFPLGCIIMELAREEVPIELEKFQMAVYGQRQDSGGVCDNCGKHRAVAWVEELQGGRCSSCLAGTSDRRGRPKGSRNVAREIDDQMWLKEHYPKDYAEMFGTEAPDEEAPETVEDIMKRAGKMGPPSPPRPVEEE